MEHKEQGVVIGLIRRNGVDWDVPHENAAMLQTWRAFWVLRANSEVFITLL